MAVNKQILFLWDVMTCILVDMYSPFQEKQENKMMAVTGFSATLICIYQIKEINMETEMTGYFRYS